MQHLLEVVPLAFTKPAPHGTPELLPSPLRPATCQMAVPADLHFYAYHFTMAVLWVMQSDTAPRTGPRQEGEAGMRVYGILTLVLAHLSRLQPRHLLAELMKDLRGPAITPGLNNEAPLPLRDICEVHA